MVKRAAFSAPQLAAACHTSYRTLHQRSTQAAGQSPLDYLQALRMEHAKVLLEDGHRAGGDRRPGGVFECGVVSAAI